MANYCKYGFCYGYDYNEIYSIEMRFFYETEDF